MRRKSQSANARWALSALVSAGLLAGTAVVPLGCARSARDLGGESLSTEDGRVPLVPVAETTVGDSSAGRKPGGKAASAPRPSLWERIRLAAKGLAPRSSKRPGDPFLNAPETRVAAAPASEATAPRLDANAIASGRPDSSGAARLAPGPYAPLPGPKGNRKPTAAPSPGTALASHRTEATVNERAPRVASAETSIAEQTMGRQDQVVPGSGVDRDMPVRVIPRTAAGRSRLAEVDAPAATVPPSGTASQRHVVTSRPKPESLESADQTLVDALRLRVEQLADKAREAEERGAFPEAAALWGMAAHIEATNPGLLGPDDVHPSDQLAGLESRKRLHLAKSEEVHSGQVGRASIRGDVPDLRDRNKQSTPELATTRTTRIAPPVPTRAGKHRELEATDPSAVSPAQRPPAVATRAIPDDPHTSPATTAPRGKTPDVAATPPRQVAPDPTHSGHAVVDGASQNETPTTAQRTTARTDAGQGTSSRPVRLAGSTQPAVSPETKTPGQRSQAAVAQRRRSDKPVSSETIARVENTTQEDADVPIDPRTGISRTRIGSATEPGRRRIDPQVASNLARAEGLAAEEAERVRAAKRPKPQPVELLPEPPRPDPAEVIRREAAIAARKKREAEERLAAEKRAADLAYKGPVIRSMTAGDITASTGDELTPGKFPTVRSNTAPAAVATVPGGAPAAAPAPGAPSVAAATTPAKEPPQLAAVSAPLLTPPPTDVSPGVTPPPAAPVAAAPVLTPPPAQTVDAVASAAPPGPSLTGPSLGAPPVDPPAAQPAPTPTPAAAGEAGAVTSAETEPVAEADEHVTPVLTWRRFWVPLGGLVAGIAGLAGLMFWRVWERRHFQSNRRTISMSSTRRTIPGRPVVAGKVASTEQAAPQRRAA